MRNLEGLNVLDAVKNLAADFQKTWPIAGPSPAREGLRRDVPAGGELVWTEVADERASLFGVPPW